MANHQASSPPRPASRSLLRRRAVIAALAALTVLGIAGCSVDDVSSPPDGDGPADDLAVGVELGADFADPADAGFDPVVDVDVDPTELAATEVTLDVGGPDDAVADAAEDLAAAEPGEDTLASIDPIDEAAPAGQERDGRTRNEAGELALLDTEANLACAQAEIALESLDDGLASIAAERVASAAVWAGDSTLADVQAWSGPLGDLVLDGDDDVAATLVAFLSVCAAGGYEL